MTRWLERLRLPVIAASILLLVVGAAGTLRLSFDSDTRVYFDEGSAERRALSAIEERHGRVSTAVFIVEPAGGNVYAADALAAISDVVQALAGVPEVAVVNAITEFDVDGRSDDGAALRAYAEDHGRLSAPLVAVDGSLAAIVATLRPGARTNWDVVTDLRAVRDAAERSHEGTNITMTGSAVLDASFIDALRADLPRLVPAQIVLLTILLIVTLGSLSATLALFAVLGVATAAAVGAVGWLGLPLNGVTSAIPTVLLGLAVATSVHIILAWQHALRDDSDVRKAVAHAIAINAKPVTLAIATTVASFLCLNFSASPPFRQFGNFVAFGLALTWVLSFTLLPVLLLLIPPSRALARRPIEAAMSRLGAGVLGHRVAVLLLVAAAIAAAVFGVTRMRFDDTFAHYFDHRFEIRQATDLYEERLSGITVVEMSVPAGDDGTFATRSGLAALHDLVDWLESQPKVDRATSILDVLALAGQGFPGALDAAGLPVGDFIAARLVDTYADGSMAGAPPGLLDPDDSHAHVSVVLGQISSAELIVFADTVNRELERRLGAEAARVTGAPILAAHLSSTNTRTMFVGTLVALASISLILAFALGGFRMGIVSLVPNLVPLLLAYGFWGLVFQEVSFAATVVVAMTFGIVVDDTVHILSRYQLLRRGGLDPGRAVLESLRTVGVAVVITSVAIASGFAVLAFSGFLVNRDLGLLTVITLVAALLTDLLFLPLLLVLFDRKRERSGTG